MTELSRNLCKLAWCAHICIHKYIHKYICTYECVLVACMSSDYAVRYSRAGLLLASHNPDSAQLLWSHRCGSLEKSTQSNRGFKYMCTTLYSEYSLICHNSFLKNMAD